MPTQVTITITDKWIDGKEISKDDMKAIATKVIEHIQTLTILSEPTVQPRKFIVIKRADTMNTEHDYPTEYTVVLHPHIETI